jgi:hypothetical protein
MWIPGEAFEDWGARGPYATRAECLVVLIRSEMEFSETPREYPARFMCSTTPPRLSRNIEDCSLDPPTTLPNGGATREC